MNRGHELELLEALVEKFCASSYELARHYASCEECHIVGLAVDSECDAGKRIADDAMGAPEERR